MMNQHLTHTGEHLAQQCLDEAGGDYALAADSLLEHPASQRRADAVASLTLWAALAPIANDNEPV